jgi:signal transduction histidine kinase
MTGRERANAAAGREPVRAEVVPRLFEALEAIERELLAELDRDRLMRLIVDRAGRLVGADGAIYLVTGEGLVPAARTDESVLGSPIAVGAGATGLCASTGEGLVVNDYAEWPTALPDSRARGVSRVMCQPLRLADRLLGVITMSRRGDQAPAFAPEDHAVLARFAGQAALALRNATLYDEAQRRRREAEGLADLARSVASLDTRHVLDTIVKRLPALIGVPVAVALAGDGRWRFASIGDLPPPFMDFESAHPLDGVTATAITRRASVWSADILADARFQLSEATRRFIEETTKRRAILASPILAGERVLGALVAAREEAGPFGEEQVRLLETAAAYAAVALENARLYAEAGQRGEEAERRRHEAEVVARIARIVGGSLDLPTILQKVVDGARELGGSDMARIALRDPQSQAMVFRYWINVRYPDYDRVRVEPGQGVGGQVMLTGQPFRTDDWRRDARISKETLAVVEAEGIVAMLAVPIRIGERVEGLLYVDNRAPRPFTERHEAVLMRLADHAALAIHDARRFAEARLARERLAALSARLLQVQEAERRHIARELHDEVGQALTAVRMNLQLLKQSPPAPEALAGRVDETLGVLDQILQGVRQLSLDLRPSLLDDVGLVAALQWFVRVRGERAGLAGTVVAELAEAEVSAELATTCFRVVQEAVTNAIRHARARHLRVELRGRDGELELIVRDDGVGFDVAAAFRSARGGASLGLLSLRERVELAEGRSVIESDPGRGTTVRAWFPLSPAPGSGARPGGPP